MTDVKTIKQLIKLMSENDITELDLQDEGEKIKLCRASDNQPLAQYISAPPAAAPPAPQAPAPQATATTELSSTDSPASDGPTIDSPMVGTFYSAATPDAKPFVSAGDSVTADTVVCIIEAMKVFNEIKAEQAGTIEKVLVSNGQAVEFDQPIFVIKPA